MSRLSISVIIPCYNVQTETLERCVKSVHQAFDSWDYDVWIIDDGSAEDIIVPWVEGLNVANVHAVRQENSGPGGARNKGIELSSSDYICFVDADDYLKPVEQAYLLSVLNDKQPDILAQGCLVEYEGKATSFMERFNICPSCCSYFIKRSVLGNLRFTPGIFHEDEEFCTRLHLLDASLLTVRRTSYVYTYSEISITHNRAISHLEKRYKDFATVMKRLHNPELTIQCPALTRKLSIMAMCFILTLLADAPDKDFIRRHLLAVKETGFYPLPLKWIDFRYFIFALLTRSRRITVLLSPVVKRIMKRHHAQNHQRAFTSHIEVANEKHA